MYRKCIFLLFIICGFLASGGENALSDGEIWNQGIDAYRSGDVTNALAQLRPLMLSRTHGARAAEVVAKLEYERGNLEEAANAAQIALRAAPADQRINRNFTRAIDGLPEARETKRINDILKRHQGTDPGALMFSSTKDARALMTESGVYRTNAAEKAVQLSDSLSARARRLAECWIPLREIVSQSVTNQEQAANVIMQIEAAQAKTEKAAKELSDMDGGAYSTLADVEHDFTRMLKMVIPPPQAMEECLQSQSNAWKDVELFNGRPWQSDALDYTRSFRARFPMWARAYEQKAQADTNLPPFTAENQAKVSALATELEKLQLECVEKNLPPVQEKAISLARQIIELLPKDGGGGGGNRQQNQSQNQRQNQNNSGKDDQNPDKPQDDEGQMPKNDQDRQSGEQEQEDSAQEENKGADEKESGDDREIEALLRKAQERNDEHEAEKKARSRKAPLRPNERDW